MASSGSGLLPGIWVQGFAPLRAFGRAAASPQTRQMRCWLSAAQAAYHSFPSLPPTKTRSLRCTAFFPPKPLRGVSAGALLGAVIKAPVLHFRHFRVGVVSLPSGRFVCVGITRRGVYCSRKNGFLRAGALRRRTRCSLLHTALFRRSCMGVVSLPSACVSCCRNAGRPRVTAAYSPFLCRRGARPVRAEYPLAGYTRHPIPQTRTQRLTRRNTAGSQGRW